ncbi:hypothetical protein C8Q75DRAFT_808032 [Abortiporus biennis]|nr:hypothetical protein C8Q75DRAFT_808032 [Abortiporus biennis]
MTNDLAEGSYEDMKKIELQAFITYTFLGGIVLPYVAERQWNITKDLCECLSCTPPKLPSWLFIPSGIIPIKKTDGDKVAEEKWYKATKTFLPSCELRSRHLGMQDAALGSRPGCHFEKQKLDEIKKHIRSTWEMNITLFYRNLVTKEIEVRFMDTAEDGMKPFSEIREFTKKFVNVLRPKSAEDDTYLFANAIHFFDLLAGVIKDLKGQLKVEMLYGSVMEELAKMRYSSYTNHLADFPRSYIRMWLSNVLNYVQGLLDVAIYVLPNLDLASEAACGWSYLSGICSNENLITHIYSLLTVPQVPHFLSCTFITTKPISQCFSIHTQSLPHPLFELASCQELMIWLTHQFFNTIISGWSVQPPNQVVLPNNLIAFFGILVYLHRVGYPGHWLSEFVQSILAGSLISEIAPYVNEWPIPPANARKRVKRRYVRLDPWLPDLENILAVCWQGLPFTVSLPKDFARSAEDLGTYSAQTTGVNDPFLMNMFHP